MAHNNGPKTPQQEHHENVMLGSIVMLLVAAGIYRKQYEIKVWFYDHLMELVFWGFILIVALSLWIRWKVQIKNKDKIERARSLNTIKPTDRRRDDYYTKQGGHFDD